MSSTSIPGYEYRSANLSRSPVTEQDLELLTQTVLLTSDDKANLRRAGEVLESQIDDVLDVWYGFVGSHPHLAAYFSGADAVPDPSYMKAVRARFGQWIRDTCRADYDQSWLDYQHEIGLRHTAAKKNLTDNVSSAAPQIHLRYLIAFIYPITATIEPFLAKGGDTPEVVGKMHQAWFKSVVLQITLWTRPYLPESSW